ncbi:phage holin family protein [Macrococcus equipercicus]|uniref:Phage holin family protein n=1 Tax=Macrococcus equipercicus TaxID=69967 RepID=A0A9Q9BNG4_9STAP|nr:phage holin family protein [Macrococcus equipercicus]UTH14778.1 phage holin family protein [Macrococcus equipercicus]
MDKVIFVTESDTFKQFFYNGDLFLIKALIILMIADIATGVMKAFVAGNLWSRKSLFGYARKMLVFCIIILANIIDQIINMEGGLVKLTIMFYIANEGLSIFENAVQLGLPVPQELKEKLAVISDGKSSIRTEIKEEFSTNNTPDLPGGELNVNVKVQPEKNEDL